MPALSQAIPGENASSLPAVNSGSLIDKAAEQKVLPVFFPAQTAPNFPVSPAVPTPVPVAVPGAASAPAKPAALSVSQMRGEVHFKHLEGPRLDPSRALYVETGAGVSFCEFKMANCVGRTWSNSQVVVFPESGIIYLNKGALILQVKHDSAARYTILAGDLSCRVESCTIRVQKDERSVNFQVLDSTPITVFNRRTGEISRASKITIANP